MIVNVEVTEKDIQQGWRGGSRTDAIVRAVRRMFIPNIAVVSNPDDVTIEGYSGDGKTEIKHRFFLPFEVHEFRKRDMYHHAAFTFQLEVPDSLVHLVCEASLAALAAPRPEALAQEPGQAEAKPNEKGILG